MAYFHWQSDKIARSKHRNPLQVVGIYNAAWELLPDSGRDISVIEHELSPLYNHNSIAVPVNPAASLQEITMLIPLEKDMNPGRAGNYQSSFVDTDIKLSEDGIFEYNVHDDYAGSFRIIKQGGKYYEQLQMKEWNSEKGVFDDIIGKEILLQDKNNQPLATNQLDAFAKAQMNMLFVLAQQNIAKKEAWKTQNPNKVQK